MKFYKFRGIVAIYLTKFIAWILRVEMPPILSVGAIIQGEDKKILFVKLSYQNGYGLPGGIVQGGETIEQALSREVYEETGLKVINSKMFLSTPSKYKGIDTISITFIVKAIGKVAPSNEGTLEWKKINEVIDNLAYKDTRQTLNKFIKNEQ